MKYSLCISAGLCVLALSGCSHNQLMPTPEIKSLPMQPIAPLVQHLVFFDWDKDIPPTDIRDILKPHVQYLIKHPTRKLLVEGGADESGDYQYNVDLGMKRAMAIEALLIDEGISREQLIVRSIGIERKLNLENKPHSLPRNRRVTLIY